MADLRIDFAAAAALIGPRSFRVIFVMSASSPDPSTPLAEISQGPSAFEAFLDRNQKSLVVLAILLALGTAGYVIYQGVEQGRQESAGAALNKAGDLAALQAVVTEHANTHAAKSAMVLLADRQWTEGQQDQALATLRNFIAADANHPARPTAQASLGAKLMAQGKSAEAAKVFDELIHDSKGSFLAPFAHLALGDMARSAGELDKAEAAYKEIVQNFSDSNFVETAHQRIASLKTKPPVEIAPPPAPKTETPSTTPAIDIKPAAQDAAPQPGNNPPAGATPPAPPQP